MNEKTVTLAAQADLVLLTVDMLRPQWDNIPTAIEANNTPEADSASSIIDELLRHALGDRAKITDDTASGPTPVSALADVLRCASELSHDDWADEYWRMFDGAQACPLNQASYIRRDKGTILGDLSGFYHAFGFQGSTTEGERPDHLLCQLEFVAMMLAMASQAPDGPSRETVMKALSRYACDHMHDWLPAACWQMCESTHIEYFGAVSQWLLVLWQTLSDLQQWPSDLLPSNHLTPIVDPDDPYECGAPDLHQIQPS